jgi:two-component system sensor histidine kinase AgrC
MEIINNIWLALSTENVKLINILLIPSSFIEFNLIISLFLSILGANINKKQKLLNICILAITSIFITLTCPSPYNTFIGYIVAYLITLFIFKLNPVSTLFGILFSIVVFTLTGSLILNPYLKILCITYSQAELIPIYRMSYLFILYSIVFIITYLIKKFKIYIGFIDKFSKKNKNILIINISLGLFTFIGQIFFLSYYAETFSISYNLFTCISLLCYFSISLYSLTRMAKLITTTLELQSAEEYNKSLSVLYDTVKGFKHDFDNIVSTINGYIETDDMDGLKSYFIKFHTDCQRTNNIAKLNPSIINNPGIYSLLNSKYHKADKLGIQINLDFFVDLNDFNIDTYEFSRILGILLDNAIEAASECKNKIINIKFRNEQNSNRHTVIISNTYINKDVNIQDIFSKGKTNKSNHSGLGLYEVNQYINKNNDLNLFTTKSDELFTQQLEISYSNKIFNKSLIVLK